MLVRSIKLTSYQCLALKRLLLPGHRHHGLNHDFHHQHVGLVLHGPQEDVPYGALLHCYTSQLSQKNECPNALHRIHFTKKSWKFNQICGSKQKSDVGVHSIFSVIFYDNSESFEDSNLLKHCEIILVYKEKVTVLQ